MVLTLYIEQAKVVEVFLVMTTVNLEAWLNLFPTLGDLGADTVGNTYVTLLSNLNYGTGSRNYAINSNMALMKGIQVPQIQYA